MSEAREFNAGPGDEFRVICPDCKTVWSTLTLPAECLICAATITVRVTGRPKKNTGEER